jgi:hypothetical protein
MAGMANGDMELALGAVEIERGIVLWRQGRTTEGAGHIQAGLGAQQLALEDFRQAGQ